MIGANWYDSKSERELYVELYSKGQTRIDISLIDSLPGAMTIELDKKQVSELIVALVEIHKEMN